MDRQEKEVENVAIKIPELPAAGYVSANGDQVQTPNAQHKVNIFDTYRSILITILELIQRKL